MLEISKSEVVVFHDDTKSAEGGKYKGHVLLFIPKLLQKTFFTPLFGKESIEYSPIMQIYEKIQRLRDDYHIGKKLSFKEISGARWGRFDLGVRQVIEIAVDALRSKRSSHFKMPLCCKLAVVYYPKRYDREFYRGDDPKEKGVEYDETVLRMLLKGAVHYLYDKDHTVSVIQLNSDGMPYHRTFSENRVMWRITYDELRGKSALRNYVTFPRGAHIRHLPSDHRDYVPDSDQYIAANCLQIADLLLGSVRWACCEGIVNCPRPPSFGSSSFRKKDVIAYPAKQMIDKLSRGRAFRWSGHNNSFSIRRIEVDGFTVKFNRLHPKDITFEDETMNLSLFGEPFHGINYMSETG